LRVKTFVFSAKTLSCREKRVAPFETLRPGLRVSPGARQKSFIPMPVMIVAAAHDCSSVSRCYCPSLPEVLETPRKYGAAKGDNGVGPFYGPVHPRPLEPHPYVILAPCLNDTGRRARPMGGAFSDKTGMDRILYAIFMYKNKSEDVYPIFLVTHVS
jgi:hypothetical protein